MLGNWKKSDGINADGTQSMFALKILGKTEGTRLKVSQGSVSAL